MFWMDKPQLTEELAEVEGLEPKARLIHSETWMDEAFIEFWQVVLPVW